MDRKRIEDGFYPSDLKNMSLRELELLCAELRAGLIDTVSETGGHIAPNLGVVELTVALHRVFDAPKDKIVWDVGHQSYIHKMLTGRGADMKSLRQYGGLSGFPKRSESEYDTFDTGHSSTSISAALGMAAARDLKGEDYAVISVIGDGAMTGGMVYEALNNAGVLESNFIVVLNDNGMSISRNRGGLSQHLSGLRTSQGYQNLKKGVKNRLNQIPVVGGRVARRMSSLKDAVKYVFVPGILFEELGFTYIGPVDGHNLEDLIEMFEDAKEMKRPVLIHCITQKGRGYRPAEQNPAKFHGIGPFDKETGALKKKSTRPSWSAVFGNKLTEMAEADSRIVAVSAAMIDGTGLKGFERAHPDRIFDVGIAEEHAVTFAAGMAASGLRPFAAIYSTFMQRAYDQIMIDVCMQNLPVVFCLDRAGLVGADGETHQGIFDLSYLSHMPNLTLLAPSDADQLEQMMDYALTLDGPCAIRYPRGTAADLSELKDDDTDNDTNAIAPAYVPGPQLLREGGDVCILAVGSMVEVALYASISLQLKGIRATVCDVQKIAPLSPEDIAFYRRAAANAGRKVICIEDNVTTGGFGSIIEGIFARDPSVRVVKMGWPDEFIPHGSREELMRDHGLDAAGIAEKVSEICEGKA